MSVESKSRNLSIVDCDDWWGGKDLKLEPAQPPPVEWGYIPKSPFTGRSSSRTGRRPASQEYELGSRPKTAPAWTGSSKGDLKEWDSRHHISFSRKNEHFPSSLREYFPTKPKVPMARQSMYPESFVLLDHIPGKGCLFQRPPKAMVEHPPKFTQDIWRQADPYLADAGSVSPIDDSSCSIVSVMDGGCVGGVHASSDGSIMSRRSTPGGTMRNRITGEVESWDDRASLSISKHNTKLHSNQREYFFPDRLSSPPDYYHNQKWRNISPSRARSIETRRKPYPGSSSSSRISTGTHQ